MKNENFVESGIHEINFNLFIATKKVAVRTRSGELLAHIKYSRREKSSVARNILYFEHSIKKTSLKFVRQVIHRLPLDAYESLKITNFIIQ